MKLVICEKPSVAKAVASALGVTSRADGCFEGNGLIVSWCVGHLVSPMDAAGYDLGYKKWKYDDLPILPEPFRYVLAKGKEDAFQNLKHLMEPSVMSDKSSRARDSPASSAANSFETDVPGRRS